MLQSYSKDTDFEIEKKEIKEEALSYLSRIIQEILELPETDRVKGEVIENILKRWAGNSRSKQFLTERVLKRRMRKKDQLTSLPTKPENLEVWRNVGEVIQRMIRFVTLKNTDNPSWMADLLRAPLIEILESVDFGDLYDMIASGEKRAVALQQMIQDVMEDYQTKAGIVPAIKLKQINTSLKKLNMTLSGTNDVPPDILAKTLFCLVDAIIEKEELGLLGVNISEILRKLKVGNILEGEAGKGFHQIVLTRIFEEVINTLDPTVTQKAISAWAEFKEGAGHAFYDAAADHPDFLLALTTAYFDRQNARIRLASKKASVWEECPPEELGRHVSRGLIDLDTEELAETVNTLLRIGNEIKDAQPDVIFSPVSSFIAALDRDELSDALTWLIPDLVRGLKPVSHTVLPEAIKGFCEWLKPVPGQDRQEMDEAIAMLRNTILGEV